MAAHSYWRVRMWKATGNSNNAIRIAELEFITAGTGQLATPTQALSSGDYSATYSKDQLIDGLKTTGIGWASTIITNAWAGAYFATPVDIEAIKIYHTWQSDTTQQLCVAGAIALEYSDNGTDWTEQSRDSMGVSVIGETIIVGYNRLPGFSKQARYWRLSDIDNDNDLLRLSRIQLWRNTSRVCTAATLTGTVAPVTGSLEFLQTEGNSVCDFNRTQAKGYPTFTWDAGSGNTMDVLLVRFAGPENETFVKNFTLSYSDDNLNWTTFFVSQKYKLKFPGSYALTNKADPDKLIKPEIEAIGSLDSFLVDNTAQTVNLRYNDRNNLRAVIPIFTKVRSHFELTLPDTGDMRWYISLLQVDITNPSQRGIYEYGWTGSAALYQRATVVDSFGATLTGITVLASDYSAGSVIGFSFDPILGYFTATTASSRVCFKHPKLTEDNLFFVISRDPTVAATNQTQDRIFSFNFGETPFTRPQPSGYLASAGTFYEYESTQLFKSSGTIITNPVVSSSGEELDPTVNRGMVGFGTVIAKYEQYCGRGYIKNRVYTKGSPNNPAKKKVALFDMATNIFVAETVSDHTGLFEFKFLDEKLKYVAMALDELGQWEPACTGPLTPSIMPMVTA